jgi:hypothetical protein
MNLTNNVITVHPLAFCFSLFSFNFAPFRFPSIYLEPSLL